MATRGRKQNKKRVETRAFFEIMAERTSLPKEVIRHVLETFNEVVLENLIEDNIIILRHFMKLEARVSPTGQLRIRFKPANDLKRRLKEGLKTMEKYGVELNNEAALLAKVTGTCPACKSALESKDPPRCPNCGTSPFESKPATARQSAMVENFGKLYGKDENGE